MALIVADGEDDVLHSSERPHPGTVNDYCRLCANVGDNMVPIYADEGADHGLEIKIKTHLPFLNIRIDDILPKRICYHCASAVLVWDELFEFSTVADSKLRDWFCSSSYDQRDCKTVPYDVMGQLNADTVEFEDISDVNIFSRNEKSVRTFNLDKISNSSKPVNILNHELKSTVSQKEEKFNSDLKRYMNESDESLKNFTTKETSLSKHYSCSFCTEIFLKIRDKVKHERDIHGIQTNILPIKYVSDGYVDNVRYDDDEKNNTVQNYSNINDLNEKDIPNNLLCITCNISFETEIEKQEHDQKFHSLQLTIQQSSHVVSPSYGELFINEESDLELITQNNILNTGQFNNKCVKSEPVDPTNDSELFVNEEEVKENKDELDQIGTHCFYCGKQFSSKNVASKHVCSHMPNLKKQNQKSDIYDKYKVIIDNKLYYKCDQCTYAVEGRRYKFVYHMRVHTGEKPYTCEMCSKQFRTAAFLRRHVVCFHDKVRGYQCDICGRSFSEKRNVDDHRRTHTGERPFVCETCGKSFAQRSSMKIHWKQMHESIKSHKCQYCDKRFIRKCHLVAHLTHHTGVRNYVCAVCGKAFLRSGTLKGHTAVHSLERPFKCTICGDSFKLKKHLKQHGRVHEESRSTGHFSQMEFIQTDNHL